MKISNLTAVLFLSILSFSNLQSSEVGASQCVAGRTVEVKVAFEGPEGSAVYSLSAQEAALSGTLRNLIEGYSEEEIEIAPIDLTRISDKIGSIIAQLMKYAVFNASKDNLTDQLVDKIKSFNLTHEDIINLFKAINYLDIPILEEALISYIKNHVTGASLDKLLKQVLLHLPAELIEKLLYLVPLKPPYPAYSINDRQYEYVSMSSDGNTIVAGGRNGDYIFNRSGRLIGSNTEIGYVSALSSEGNTIVARGNADNVDYVYVLNRRGEVISSNTERKYEYVSMSSDGNTIVARGSFNGFIYILDRDGRLIGSNTERKYEYVSMSSDGNTIVARGYGDNFIYIFDRDGNKISSSTERLYSNVSMSSDGNTIVARGYFNGYIYILDRNGRLIGSNTERLYSNVSISSDGNTIVAMVYHHIYIFDKYGEVIASNAERMYSSVSISSNGNTIVAIGCDGFIYILNRCKALSDLILSLSPQEQQEVNEKLELI